MEKKAQIKFGETFGVIIIVFILLMSGLTWYNKISQKEIYELKEKDQFDKSFEIFNYILNLNLIHSSQRGIIDDEFDYHSLIVFSNYSNTTSGKELLQKQLGTSLITIEIYNYTEIQGDMVNHKLIILYNNSEYITKFNRIKRFENFRTLVPVINSGENRVDLGILKIQIPFKE